MRTLYLVELQGSVVHRWTDAPIDLIWKGNTYKHGAPFTVDEVVIKNGRKSRTITFDEGAMRLRGTAAAEAMRLRGFDAGEELRDCAFSVYEAWTRDANPRIVRRVKLFFNGRVANSRVV